MSKYDWSNVPSNMNWIATDADGNAFEWEFEPEMFDQEWLSGESIVGGLISAENNPFRGDWKDSLEERPK